MLGMNITFVTLRKQMKKGYAVEEFGLPFKNIQKRLMQWQKESMKAREVKRANLLKKYAVEKS